MVSFECASEVDGCDDGSVMGAFILEWVRGGGERDEHNEVD